MYENGKMRPVETIPGMGGGGIKETMGGVNSINDIQGMLIKASFISRSEIKCFEWKMDSQNMVHPYKIFSHKKK
jgi:hypothetical protein